MKPNVTRRSFLKGAACGLAGAVAAGAYGDLSAKSVRLEQVELTLPRWKADGLRVGFITDIHVNDADEMLRAQAASQLIADQKPDLVVFGGDAVNWNYPAGLSHIEPSFEPLKRLKCPKIAILGNHDYWSKVVGEIELRLANSGFRVLKNEIADFGSYRVAGWDDRIGGKRDPDFKPSGESLISLMHEPDDVDFVPDSASLQLSGHSHGGQICLPFGIVMHTPYLSHRYRRGYFPDAKVPLYVSRGVGTTGPKWRMFCPPEVTLLTLRSAR